MAKVAGRPTETNEDSAEPKAMSTPVLAAAVIGLIFLLANPWMFGISVVFLVCGFYVLEPLADKYPNLLSLSNSNRDNEAIEEEHLDPLMHVSTPLQRKGVPLDVEPTSNGVKRSSLRSQDQVELNGSRRTSSPSSLSIRSGTSEKGDSSQSMPKGSSDLKIDPRLESSIAKFCNAFFDFYISSVWAPYETRLQLRLAIKLALTKLAERIAEKLEDKEDFEQFVSRKVLPLLLHYVHKIQLSGRCGSSSPDSPEAVKNLEHLCKLRIRNSCVKLVNTYSQSEDLKCKLWSDLVVTVLSDGVFWNLFLIAKEQIPLLCLGQAQQYTTHLKTAHGPDIVSHFSGAVRFFVWVSERLESVWGAVKSLCQYQHDRSGATTASEPIGVADEVDDKSKLAEVVPNPAEGNEVHFLLDSFLDPSNDINQPDWIVSRWRPSLDVILVERELLYCLIQYLKGHRALEYLQAVLDESTDGSTYCKKMLQLEYLPRFSRSRVFMESMGISLVDSALEAGSDSPTTRAKLGHTRSASFGGANSGIQIWKIGDPKAVDGLPLHAVTQGLTLEPEMLFNSWFGRNNAVEGILGKFMHMAMNTPSKEVVAEETLKTTRVGTDIRVYEDFNSPEVQSNVLIDTCDDYDCLIEILSTLVASHPGLRLVGGGWLRALRPFLKPVVERQLRTLVWKVMTIENAVQVAEFATSAFNSAYRESSTEIQTEANANEELCNDSDVKYTENYQIVLHRIVSNIMDVLHLAHIFHDNCNEILLFLVDLLEMLENYLS